MSYPLDSILNPTLEQLYDDLYLDYFFDKTKKAFPSIYGENKDFQILIRLMAWAVARSYQQPRILKYLYNPDLVLDILLPKLADTLDFSYPLEYDLSRLRVLIKYLQKIRRTRGTFTSIKQLIRLLETTEEDILNMTFTDYSSVTIEEPIPGFLLIHYNRINDFDFANEMLKLVMMAGYNWRLESGLDTKGLSVVYRNRIDFIKESENFFYSGDSLRRDDISLIERMLIDKINQPI